jgi:hypothetical protein
LGKVKGVENSVENLGEEGNRSLGKMIQGPVLDTVWTRVLAELETHDSFMNLVRFG